VPVLPPEVRALLAGQPDDSAWEPVAHLLTTDDDGFPRVCLLSRAELTAGEPTADELAAGADTVSCVVRARHTIANLRRTGQGLLAVAGGEAAYYVRLRVLATLAEAEAEAEAEGRRLAATFAVVAVEQDTLGVPLRPMTFRTSAALRSYERWDENRALLERVAAMAADDGTE
jgi:predicted pyridoxine 5'-phosphate oxidase superfamily flavin-nucleotide-binding protein